MKSKLLTGVFLFLILSVGVSAQVIVSGDARNETRNKSRNANFFGIKPRPEIQQIIAEIERKSGRKIYARFIEQTDFMFGSSYISEEGKAVVLIDSDLENDPKKLEAVAAHELLHLRLRVNNFPTFLFSETVQTAKGRAVDVEQPTANDLLSLIEHRAFKSEMERLGLDKFINLAGDTAKVARQNKNLADSQSDSINYARAILEYPNQKDIDEVAAIYRENRWTRALQSGKSIADFINQSNLQTPQAVEAIFLKCMTELYRPPATHHFTLAVDGQNKFFRRMIINITRKTPARRKNR